tara:strand:- start:378 stop:782 length:405 start_codon:yes stop_codon:yes gene_type:complete
MRKIKLKNKNKLNPFFNLFAIILIILSININRAYAINNNWIQVSKTNEGIQYWDRGSLINKSNGLIEIKTKYFKKDAENQEIIEENIYTMEINCINNKYKDISVNGKINLSAKWEAPNGDKLINDLISESCQNV